jgi:hypothetical protein
MYVFTLIAQIFNINASALTRESPRPREAPRDERAGTLIPEFRSPQQVLTSATADHFRQSPLRTNQSPQRRAEVSPRHADLSSSHAELPQVQLHRVTIPLVDFSQTELSCFDHRRSQLRQPQQTHLRKVMHRILMNSRNPLMFFDIMFESAECRKYFTDLWVLCSDIVHSQICCDAPISKKDIETSFYNLECLVEQFVSVGGQLVCLAESEPNYHEFFDLAIRMYIVHSCPAEDMTAALFDQCHAIQVRLVPRV